MRRGKKMLALLLAFTMVFQLLPTSVLSLTTQQIDLSPIVYEGFEVGESFAMNNDPTEEIVMNKAYYGDYAQSGPYAAAWTNAHPVADSYVEAYWDSSAKYGSGSNSFAVPAMILRGGYADTSSNECIGAQIRAKSGVGQNGRVFINYNLYANKAAISRMEDGATYVFSVKYKSSKIASDGGGKCSLRVVTAAAPTTNQILFTSNTADRSTSWTSLELEFVYKDEYKDNLILQIFTGNGNGGTLYIDDLKLEKKDAVISVDESAQVRVGKTKTLTASVRPVDSAITWQSSDESVVTVDQNGVITGVSAGSATITVSSNTQWGAVSDTCQVTVREPSSGYVLVFQEEFEVGESFEENTNSGIVMNQQYYTGSDSEESQYQTGVKYPAIWNEAQPKSDSYVEAFWDPSNNYYSNYKTPSMILSGGQEDASAPGDGYVVANMRGAQGRVYLNYNLYKNTAAMNELEDGETYVVSVMYKTTSTGGKPTLAVVLNAIPAAEEVIVKSAAANRQSEWTKLEVEFVYREAYEDKLIIQIHTGSGNGGMLCLDSLKVVKKVPTVQQIQMDASESFLKPGESFTLAYSLLPAGIASPMVFRSSNPAVATVDQNGNVTAVSEGRAVITVTAENGDITEECTIFVVDNYVALTGISLNEQSINVVEGLKRQLILTKTPENATVTTTTWHSSNEDVAVVDANGLVTGIAPGNALITVTVSYPGASVSATCSVTVDPRNNDYSLIFKEEFEVGESFEENTNSGIVMNQQYYTGSDSEESQYQTGVKYPAIWNEAQPKSNSYVEAFWDPSNNYYSNYKTPSMILSGGQEDASAPGDGYIVANMRGAQGRVYLNYNLYKNTAAMNELEDGETYVVSVMYKTTSTGGKPTLAVVLNAIPATEDVIVKSAAANRQSEWTKLEVEFVYREAYEDKLIIQIHTGSGNGGMLCLDSLKVVKKVPTVQQIRMDASESFLKPGESFTLAYSLLPAGIASPMVFRSSNPAVATVDQNGNVTAVSEGQAVITVTAENGDVSVQHYAIVAKDMVPLSNMVIDRQTLTVKTGMKKTLSVIKNPNNAATSLITWSSSDESVATVDQNGVVTGLAAGMAVITASVRTPNGSVSCSCTVTVEDRNFDYVLVFREEFEMGETFEPNSNSGIVMSQEYYTGISSKDPSYEAGKHYGAVWNGAQPKAGSFLEAFWDPTNNYYGNYKQPSMILSAGLEDWSNPDVGYVEANMLGYQGRVFINYNLYRNTEAMSKLEDGETYIISVMYKHSSTGGKPTIAAVLNSVPSSDQIIVKSKAAERQDDWTKLQIEFVYREEYKDNLIIQIHTGSGNGGILSLDSLKMVKKVPAVQQVQLGFADTYMEPGNTLTLDCTLQPAGIKSPLRFVSSDPSVATVDKNGKVTAVSVGNAVITVTAENGDVESECTIMVVSRYVPLTGITITNQIANVNPGYRHQLSVSKQPADATENRITWTSSDERVAKVDAQGNVVALTTGTTVITAAMGDFVASYTLNVTDAEGYRSTSANVNVTYCGTTELNLSGILPGSYDILAAPSKGKASISNGVLTYTASAEVKEDPKGEYIDQVRNDQLLVVAKNADKYAIITVNVQIGKLGDLFYDENGKWISDVVMFMTQQEYEAIMLELKDKNSLRYHLLLESIEHANQLLDLVPEQYTKPEPDAQTSYDTSLDVTGDYTSTFLMAYLFTKGLPEFREKNSVYLQKTIEWVTASLQYPFWGTRGYQNQDVAASHMIISVSLVYHWLKDELKDLRIDHIMGTDGSTEEKWNETVKTENLPILEAIEKRLWQVGTDMYSRNLTNETYGNNHMNFRMNGLLMAAVVLRQQKGLTQEQQQTLIKWTGEALFKQSVSMGCLQPDGTSHEGVNFWSYGGLYIVKSNIIAEGNFGFNLMKYYQLFKDSGEYVLFNTLPADQWNINGNGYCWINIGDCQPYLLHGTIEVLRYLAALYGDTTAQWIAGVMEDKNVSPLNSSQWLSIIVADPNVEAKAPSAEDTLRWFKELDIVISRSGWTGNETVFTMKTGTPTGKTLTWRLNTGDFVGTIGAGHAHPDANHINIYFNGEYLLRDDGNSDKYTSNHNTLLVNGQGQAGDMRDYLNDSIYAQNNLIPCIKFVQTNREHGYEYIVGDATDAYAMGNTLTKFERNAIFLKEDNVLLVVDNIQTSRAANLELRWFPSSRSLVQFSDRYRIVGKSSNMDFYAFTSACNTGFESVNVHGYGGVSFTQMAFRQTCNSDAWQNAVAFSWAKSGENVPVVVYEPGNTADEHRFCVNGKIYTLNVSTNTLTVTKGQLTKKQIGAANDSTISAVVLNHELFKDFDPSVKDYAINLDLDDGKSISVEAFPNADGAKVDIKTDSKKVVITCTSRDGSSKTEYTFSINDDRRLGKLPIVGAESDVTGGDYDLTASYDGVITQGNEGPYWIAKAPDSGKITVTYDLGTYVRIQRVDLALHNSKNQTNYYDLLISLDGKTWTTVQELASIAPTADISSNSHAARTVLKNQSLAARYIRIVLRGNSMDGINNLDRAGVDSGINEISVYGWKLSGEVRPLIIQSATTDTPREGYDLNSTFDGIITIANNGSYWTVQSGDSGRVTVTYDLGELCMIQKVDLAMHNSISRTNYYDLLVSEDGENWIMVQEAAAAMPTADISPNNHAFRTILDGQSILGRYVRIVLRANSFTDLDAPGVYNGINEIKIYGATVSVNVTSNEKPPLPDYIPEDPEEDTEEESVVKPRPNRPVQKPTEPSQPQETEPVPPAETDVSGSWIVWAAGSLAVMAAAVAVWFAMMKKRRNVQKPDNTRKS